ncbi:MAG: class II fructose-bisphosphate aldolase [Minisyncoccia bacterium]
MKVIDYINNSENKKFALGHFNFSTIDQLWAIFNAAKKLNTPILVGVSEGERHFIGIKQCVALIKSIRDEFNFPIFLNADHTHSLEEIKLAAQAGFDCILCDGSALSFEENIKMTKEAVKIVKDINPEILVEGELGYIGSGSEVFQTMPSDIKLGKEFFTKPEEAEQFVKETNIDLFSPAVGSIHGMFKNQPNPNLAIDLIREIKKATKKFLVLHGGSGVSNSDFIQAIDAGINIIHISTELRLAWRNGIENELIKNKNEIAPYKLLTTSLQEVEKVVENRLKLFFRNGL